jgi:hypothetical protein
VTSALLAGLRDEKDVALRNCIHDSLGTITGKRVAQDFKAWDEAINGQAPAEPK